jgi:heterotetrameric sarcosine oxidase gamma subunit
VSAHEASLSLATETGVQLSDYRSDVVEIAALRGRVREIEGVAATRGLSLPGFGRVVATGRWLTMSVRPERWLVLQAATLAGARAAQWHTACMGLGVAVDLSSALSVLHLAGPGARELLARSCRVDLHEAGLPTGRVITTVMAQVGVVIAAIPSGLLVLTPSSTARHFREWLIGSTKLCGQLSQSTRATVEMFGGSG